MYPTKKLSEIVTTIRGITYKPDQLRSKAEGVACFRTKNIQEFLDEDDIYYVDPSIIKNNDKILETGDILISSANSIEQLGKCCLIENLTYKATLGGFICAMRPNQNILNYKYFYLYFSSDKVQNKVRTFSKKTTGIANLQLKDVEFLQIPLPTLSTQSKIVAKLDEAFGNIDRQISLLKANIEDIESVRKSAMEESFQGEEYEMRKLGEITEIITGNTPPTKFPQYYDGKYLWAGPGDFGEFKTICTTNKTLSEKGVSEGKARLIKEGAVMLVAIGATIGKVGIAGIEMSTNQQINSFEVNEEFLNNEYLYYFFRKIKNFFLEKSSQTTLPILNKSQCKDIEIPLPSLPRQQEIVEHLDRVFAQTADLRSSYEAQIRDLEMLRQSLLEEAFAGRLVSE